MDPRSLHQSRAEALYAALLVEHPTPSREQVEEICAAHPELAQQLASLHEQLAAWPGAALELATPGAAPQAPGPSQPPQLSGFRCLRLLGRGGMGEVWEAEDLTLQRRVAIKLLQPSWSTGDLAVQRFQREAQAAGRVQHPAIVAVYQTGESGGRHYIVQELVPGGRTLRDEIEELRRTGEVPEGYVRHVAQRFIQLAHALQAAHDAGIVHRDLKPQNVLLTLAGEPKVADFGLALLENDLSLSRTGEFLGTYFYASPEQIEASRHEIDERSDVFSLGATLYECLTLARAFEGDTAREVSKAVVEVDPPLPHDVRRRVPAEISTICMKAIEKRPQDRYSSMRELAEDLRRFLAHEPIAAHAPSLPRRAWKWALRHPTIASLLGVSSAASIALTLLLFRSEGLRKDAHEANRQLQDANLQLEQTAAQLRVESSSAEEVVRFLLEMFEQANPEVTGNEDPTVRDLVVPALARIQSGAIENSEVRARLLQALAFVMMTTGEPESARVAFEEAVALREELGQGRSLEVGEMVLSLYDIQVLFGDSAAAERILKPWVDRIGESEAYDERLAGPLLTSLANLELRRGRLMEAREALDQAGPYCMGSNRSREVHYVQSLANLHYLARELTEAERVLREELTRCDEDLRAANPRALSLVNSLGLILTEAGRLEEAETLYLDTIERLSESVDPSHRNMLVLRNNLARVWQQMARFEDAEALYREIIQIRQDEHGPDDLGSLEFMNNLGTCLALGGKVEEAVEVHRHALSLRRKAFGPDNEMTLQSENNLAFALQKLGRYGEALPLQEEVVAKTPPDHPAALGRRQMLESIRAKLGLQ